MRGALVIALCATGCFSDHGVTIQVDIGNTGATSIELFIGKTTCTPDTAPVGVKCGGIAPMGATNLLPGDVFFRDAPSDDKAVVTGHTVTFQLKADKPTSLPIVIAVGRQNTQVVGAATLTDLEVPLNSARVVTTTLAMANTPGSADLVKVWDSSSMTSTTSTTSSCVAVQHAQSNWQFVVPADDPDCDGLANKTDCNANAYLGSNPGGQASMPDCFGKDLSGSCMLGSLGCTDTGGITPNTCAAQSSQHDQPPVCVPSQFCNLSPRCLGFDDLPCLQNQVAQAPRVTCTIPTNTEGGPCTNQPFTPLSLDSFYTPTEKCDQPLLGGFQFTPLPTDPIHTFGSGNDVMSLDSLKAPCDVTLTWRSSARTIADPDEYGLIQLHTGDRITLLPIIFHFLAPGSCLGPEQFTCSLGTSLSPSDALLACAHAP